MLSPRRLTPISDLKKRIPTTANASIAIIVDIHNDRYAHISLILVNGVCFMEDTVRIVWLTENIVSIRHTQHIFRECNTLSNHINYESDVQSKSGGQICTPCFWTLATLYGRLVNWQSGFSCIRKNNDITSRLFGVAQLHLNRCGATRS